MLEVLDAVEQACGKPIKRQIEPRRAGDPGMLVSDPALIRATLADLEAEGVLDGARACGLVTVVDTCTYLVPILPAGTRVVMTNSGKWAHYAPGNLGIDVVIGTLAECVRAAGAGRVVLDD